MPPIGSLRTPLTDLSEKQGRRVQLSGEQVIWETRPRTQGERRNVIGRGRPCKQWKGHKEEAMYEVFSFVQPPLHCAVTYRSPLGSAELPSVRVTR